jgi:phosphoribosylglycinamide formyltransferase
MFSSPVVVPIFKPSSMLPGLPSTIIIRVVSNRKDALGLKRAEKALIPTLYHNLISGQYHKKGERDPVKLQGAGDAYGADLADLVLRDSPVCAG